MTSALGQLSARVQWKHVLLAGLALLCVVTALESVSPQMQASSQQGFYTIQSARSTVEVFSVAGTYKLHDASGKSPNCQHCKPLEIEANVDFHSKVHVSDFFNRAMPDTSIRAESAEWSIRTDGEMPQRLSTEIVAPEPPPPRNLSLSIA